MNIKVIFSFIIFLLLSGCSTIGDLKDWAFDEEDAEEKLGNNNPALRNPTPGQFIQKNRGVLGGNR